MSNSVLPPETLGKVFEAAQQDFGDEDDEWARTSGNDPFLPFATQVSLVCQAWSQEICPFIFRSIKFTFGAEDPPSSDSDLAKEPTESESLNASHGGLLQRLQVSFNAKSKSHSEPVRVRVERRMECFLNLMECNPRIAGYVKEIKLYAGGELATTELNKGSATFSRIIASLTNIEFVDMTWRPEPGLGPRAARDKWWNHQLQDDTRLVIASLLSRHRLRFLNLHSAAIPYAIWDRHALPFVRVTESVCPSTVVQSVLGRQEVIDATVSESVLHTQLPVPQTFGRLTQLMFYDYSHHIRSIQEVLLHNRHTLTTLRVRIRMTELLDGGRSFNFRQMEKLRVLGFDMMYGGYIREVATDFLIQALDSLPWHQMESLMVQTTTSCPSTMAVVEHGMPLILQDYCNAVDSLIWPRISSQPQFGLSNQSYFFGMFSDFSLCDTCLEFFDFFRPSTKTPWVRDLLPQLFAANQRGMFGMAAGVMRGGIDSIHGDKRMQKLTFHWNIPQTVKDRFEKCRDDLGIAVAPKEANKTY